MLFRLIALLVIPTLAIIGGALFIFDERARRSRLAKVILAGFIILVGVICISKEFIWNKGPDDMGASAHARRILQGKFGRMNGVDIDTTNFDFKNSPDPRYGSYVLHYQYGDQLRLGGFKGAITCRYNKSTGEFDRDEIIPDK